MLGLHVLLVYRSVIYQAAFQIFHHSCYATLIMVHDSNVMKLSADVHVLTANKLSMTSVMCCIVQDSRSSCAHTPHLTCILLQRHASLAAGTSFDHLLHFITTDHSFGTRFSALLACITMMQFAFSGSCHTTCMHQLLSIDCIVLCELACTTGHGRQTRVTSQFNWQKSA